MEVKEKQKKSIGHILSRIGILLGIILILVYFYMRFIEPKIFITVEYPVIDSTIPSSFNGFKIAQLSDIHYGQTINDKELTEIVEKTNLLKADLIVFTGDFLDESVLIQENSKEQIIEIMSKLNATIGKYAVTGDQDYSNYDLFVEIMTKSGFELLENQNKIVFYNGDKPIYLGGVSSISKKEPDLLKALQQETEPRAYQIFIAHEPILFDQVASQTNLMMAGHSLGGVFSLPFLGRVVKYPNTNNYIYGKYQKGTSVLYVSNGLGTQKIDFRFGNFPSITLYRLYNYE